MASSVICTLLTSQRFAAQEHCTFTSTLWGNANAPGRGGRKMPKFLLLLLLLPGSFLVWPSWGKDLCYAILLVDSFRVLRHHNKLQFLSDGLPPASVLSQLDFMGYVWKSNFLVILELAQTMYEVWPKGFQAVSSRKYVISEIRKRFFQFRWKISSLEGRDHLKICCHNNKGCLKMKYASQC